MMLHTKYQGYIICLVVSDKKIVHGSPNLSLCKTCDPQAGLFLAPGG